MIAKDKVAWWILK